MRVVAALTLVVVNVSLGWAVAAGSAVADDGNPPISECYTVAVNPPSDVQPSVTVCQP